MARYFSEQTLLDMRYEDMNEIYDLYDLEEYLTEIPTADVAPKNEVERWRRQLEAVLDEIPETKREVAREIFAEVEKIISRVLCLDINAYSAYEELKKKYGVTDTNVGNKYFTAEQVRAMSREEVSKNYSAIMKSMKTWG